MAIFDNSKSSSSSGSSNTSSWLADLINPIVADFIESDPEIYYEDSVLAGMSDATKKALDAYGSGAAIDAGKKIAGAGGQLVQGSVAHIQGLLNGGARSQFTDIASGAFNAMGGFMETQTDAIASAVYSDMAGAFGNTAQSTMASSSVSGSSAATNSQNAIAASGANSMIQQNAAMYQDVLAASMGLAGDALSAELGMVETLMDAGGNIFNAGAGMASKGLENQFNAGLFEMYYEQQGINNDRKNNMINGNMEWLNLGALLSITMPTAGLDTTTETESSTDKSGRDGIFR